MTGSMAVVFDENPEVEEDDVIAVHGTAGGKIIYGKKVLFPDIPLRQPSKGHGTACFISDLHMDEMPLKEIEKFFTWFEKEDIHYLFVAGDVGDKKNFEMLVNRHCSFKTVFIIPGNMDNKDDYPQLPEKYEAKNIVPLSNPAMVEAGGLKVLMIHDMNIDFLKKRHLGKSKLILKEDYLVLEEVPDIVHCGHTHDPQIMNYKSVTLVNSGSPLVDFRPVKIDFATREAEFVVIK
jgi:DNA polymerase II small subunit